MENTKIVFLKGKEVCIFCGKILEEQVEFDEYLKSSIYACNCEKSKRHLKLKKEAELAEKKLKTFEFKNELSSLEKEEVEFKILKRKFG